MEARAFLDCLESFENWPITTLPALFNLANPNGWPAIAVHATSMAATVRSMPQAEAQTIFHVGFVRTSPARVRAIGADD